LLDDSQIPVFRRWLRTALHRIAFGNDSRAREGARAYRTPDPSEQVGLTLFP
jgi:hypothetical protein